MRYDERAEEIGVALSPGVEEEAHLREVLHSAAFRKAPIATALLLYLWRHRSEAVSEYALATEALGRKPDFDPKVDATVRVQISRLRQKLKDFYDTDGKNCALRIAIPLGGHELAVLRSSAAVPSPRRIPWNAFLAAACALLLAACALLYWNNRTLSAAIQASKSARHQPRFWRSFFANGRPTSVFLPMPVFFEWPSTNLKIRDPLVNDFANFSTSDELQAHTKRFGPPRLLQNYTVASDTFAALNLMQYLQGKGLDLAFGSTAQLSLDFFRDHNIIIFGTPGTNRDVQRLMEKTNFYTVPGETRVVRNRNPHPGEADRYEGFTQSDTRIKYPGVIALIPGGGANTRILMLAGQHTSSLVSFLTSPPSLDLLEKAWTAAGSPEYFETVVQAELDGKTILGAWPMSLHSVNVSDWR